MREAVEKVLEEAFKNLASAVTDEHSLNKAIYIVSEQPRAFGKILGQAVNSITPATFATLIRTPGGLVGLAARKDLTPEQALEVDSTILNYLFLDSEEPGDEYKSDDAKDALIVMAANNTISPAVLDKLIESTSTHIRYAAQEIALEALAHIPLPENILSNLVLSKDHISKYSWAYMAANPSMTEEILEAMASLADHPDARDRTRLAFWRTVLVKSKFQHDKKWRDKIYSLAIHQQTSIAYILLASPTALTGWSSDDLFEIILQYHVVPHRRIEAWFPDISSDKFQGLSKSVLSRLLDSPIREVRLRTIQSLGENNAAPLSEVSGPDRPSHKKTR